MSGFEGVAAGVAAAACVTDLAWRRVPNALTIPALAAGIVAHALWPGGFGPLGALGGAAVGLAVFFPFFALGGLGGGDVKLMASLGAWVGAPAIAWTALYCALAGGVLGLVVAAAHGYLARAFANIWHLMTFWMAHGVRPVPALTLEHGRGPRLPYAVPILAGLVVALWRQ
ncbi:MAG: prepilin peptidase [Vicinamibacterales bacterium]